MPTATIKSHSDAWVAQDVQHVNHGKGDRLWVRGTGSTAARHTFISFARPFDENPALVVVSATLHLWLKNAWSGSQDVTVKRVTDTWKEDRITWANAPAPTATDAATETVSSGADKDEVQIDVTDIMQDVAAGGDFFGFRLELDDNVARAFRSSDTTFDPFHPALEVEWGFAPYPPTDLRPSGGRVVGIATPTLSWRYPDQLQETTQAKSQVQISDTAGFGTPLYDSDGDPDADANTEHRWNLAGKYTIAAGVDRFWRVRSWDDAGRPSGWSDTATFTRRNKGTLLIVNPGISNTVQDLTPTIEWTFTGVTQRQVQVQVLEVKNNGTTDQKFMFGRQKYDDDHVTVDRRNKHPRIKSGHSYRVRIWIWDNEDREDTTRDPSYVFGQRDFTYVRDGTPSPVTTLTAVPQPSGPGVVLTWTRSATPDWFCIRAANEEVIHRIEPTDTATGAPGEYSTTFWEATPRVATTYEVEAVEAVAGKYVHSDGNATKTATTNPTGIWLLDDDFDDAVRLDSTADSAPDMTIGESGTTYNPVGNRVPARITDAIRGYEGSITGQVPNAATRDTFLDIKGRDKALRLVVSDLNIPIWLEEAAVSPIPLPSTTRYAVGFNFFQVDDFFDLDD